MAEAPPSEISLAFLPDYNEAYGWYRQLRRLDQPRNIPLLRAAIVLAYIAVPIIVGIVSAALMSALYPRLTGVNFLLPFLILLMPAFYLLRRAHAALNARLRKRYLAKLNSPVPQDIRAGQDGLSFVTQDTSFRSSWTGVYRIFLLDGCVCLAIDTLTWCVPDRAFASTDLRDQFIRFALTHMGEQARARSFDTGTLASYR